MGSLMASIETATTPHFGTSLDSPVLPCPARHALEVLVIGEDGSEVEGVALELLHGRHAMHARTTLDGVARFEGLDELEFQLCPSELDSSAWTLVREESLPPKLACSEATAVWEAPVQAPNDTDGLNHVVEVGDSVDRMALEHGHVSHTIWNHPRNRGLHAHRENCNVLAERDLVFIPSIRPVQIDVQVKRRYVLRRHGLPSRLRMRLLDDFQPLRAAPWTLEIAESATLQGTTDGSGILDAWIPASSLSGVLRFVVGGRPREVTVALGRLRPVHSNAGWRMRLKNLGLRCADGDAAELSPEDRGALMRFQDSWGLPLSGEPDAATIDKLYAVHDGAATEAASSGLYQSRG